MPEHYKATIARLAAEKLSQEFKDYLARTGSSIDSMPVSEESDSHKLVLVCPSRPEVLLGTTYREALGRLDAMAEKAAATDDPAP